MCNRDEVVFVIEDITLAVADECPRYSAVTDGEGTRNCTGEGGEEASV